MEKEKKGNEGATLKSKGLKNMKTKMWIVRMSVGQI